MEISQRVIREEEEKRKGQNQTVNVTWNVLRPPDAVDHWSAKIRKKKKEPPVKRQPEPQKVVNNN